MDHGSRVHGKQPRRDAHAVRDSLIAAGDEPRRAQLSADAQRHRLVDRIRFSPCSRLQRSLESPAVYDRDACRSMQVCGQGFRDACTEPLVRRGVADVGKGKDGDSLTPKGRWRVDGTLAGSDGSSEPNHHCQGAARGTDHSPVPLEDLDESAPAVGLNTSD